MENPHAINIYTDGSTIPNPGGKSGQGIVICYPDGEIEDYIPSGYKKSTNNRSELRACVQALQYIQRQDKAKGINTVSIYTDSQYVVDGIRKSLSGYWQSVGWLTKDGNDVDNQDLLKDFVREFKRTKKRIEVIKVKGHSGNKFNEKADKLADKSREHATKTDSEASKAIVRRWLKISINHISIEVSGIFTLFIQKTDPRRTYFDAHMQVLKPRKYYGCRVIAKGRIAKNNIRPGHIYKVRLTKSGDRFIIEGVAEDMGNPTENKGLTKL